MFYVGDKDFGVAPIARYFCELIAEIRRFYDFLDKLYISRYVQVEIYNI